jgi:hypothetical protein
MVGVNHLGYDGQLYLPTLPLRGSGKRKLNFRFIKGYNGLEKPTRKMEKSQKGERRKESIKNTPDRAGLRHNAREFEKGCLSVMARSIGCRHSFVQNYRVHRLSPLLYNDKPATD